MYFHTKEVSLMSELKKKEFIAKVKKLNCGSNDLVWIAANRADGVLAGWIVGFSEQDEDQCVLVTDKGLLRNFKTVDSAIDFVAMNDLSDGAVSVAYC